MTVAIVAGVTQNYRLARSSMAIRENARGKPNTANFRLIQNDQPAPEHSQEVVLWDDTMTHKLFAGELISVDKVMIGPFVYAWDCSATDWELLLHRHHHVQRYVNQTVGQIIKDVIAKQAPGIDASGVADILTVPSFTANYRLPAEILRDLCDFYGLTYWVDYDKVLNVTSALANSAAMQITPSNSRGLVVSVDRSQLRNKIIVRGGQQASAPFTETWQGDNVQGNFPMRYKPYTPYPPALIREQYAAAAFDNSVWLEYDTVGNFIRPFPSSQANKYNSLSVSGGPGAYGTVGLVGRILYDRKDQREFRQSFILSTAGDLLLGGVSDGTGPGLATIRHGLRAIGTTLHTQEGAVNTSTGQTVVADGLTQYQMQIILKAAGAVYRIQGGAFAPFGGPVWVTLAETNVDTTANLAAVPVLVSSGVCNIYNTLFKDFAYQVKLTVGGNLKTVGYDMVDLAAGFDAVINADQMMLRFFGSSPGPSTIPPIGAPGIINLTYTYGIPVLWSVIDPVSIDRVKALEGGASDGVYEGIVNDPTITDTETAQLRGRAELDQYSNPEVSVSWAMPVGRFTLPDRPRGGQVIEIQSSDAAGFYLIQDCTLKSYGNDQYYYEGITAGSRLRSLADYFQALAARGRKFPQDPNAVLDTLIAPIDTLTFQEGVVIQDIADLAPSDTLMLSDAGGFSTANGPMPPYKWGPDPNAFIWDQAEWS